MQYRELFVLCLKARISPFEIPGDMMSGAELIEYYAILAANSLKSWGMVAELGSAFLTDFPTSMYLTTIQSYLGTAIIKLKRQNTITKELQPKVDSLKDLIKESDKDNASDLNYFTGMLYYEKSLYKSASLYFNLVKYSTKDDESLFNMANCFYQTGDIENAKKIRETMKNRFPCSPYAETINALLCYVDLIQ